MKNKSFELEKNSSLISCDYTPNYKRHAHLLGGCLIREVLRLYTWYTWFLCNYYSLEPLGSLIKKNNILLLFNINFEDEGFALSLLKIILWKFDHNLMDLGVIYMHHCVVVTIIRFILRFGSSNNWPTPTITGHMGGNTICRKWQRVQKWSRFV